MNDTETIYYKNPKRCILISFLIFFIKSHRNRHFGTIFYLGFLIRLNNEFLDGVMAIPIGKCESLMFLESVLWSYQTLEKYFITLKKVTHALDINSLIMNGMMRF